MGVHLQLTSIIYVKKFSRPWGARAPPGYAYGIMYVVFLSVCLSSLSVCRLFLCYGVC